MGLDTTHDAWHGPYSLFNRFRYKLAAEIGIDLDEYIGYGAGGTKKLEDIKHDIMPLLNHSDCDGLISPTTCLYVAAGLMKIEENLSEINADIRDDIIQFRNGCLDAFMRNENLEFH